jgi:hypothetical protein
MMLSVLHLDAFFMVHTFLCSMMNLFRLASTPATSLADRTRIIFPEDMFGPRSELTLGIRSPKYRVMLRLIVQAGLVEALPLKSTSVARAHSDYYGLSAASPVRILEISLN